MKLLQHKLSLQTRKPHVLLFVADDQGWAQLAAHRTARNAAEAQGKAETHTPHLDALIQEGVLLERHYTFRESGPSHCSLLSGCLPLRFPQKPDFPEGMAHEPIVKEVETLQYLYWNRTDNVSGFFGIRRNMTGLGGKLKQAGYATHYIGKWDAGFATPSTLPLAEALTAFSANCGVWPTTGRGATLASRGAWTCA